MSVTYERVGDGVLMTQRPDESTPPLLDGIVTQFIYTVWYTSDGGTLSCHYREDSTRYDFRRNGREIGKAEFEACFAPETIAPVFKDVGTLHPAAAMPIDFARGPV